MECSSPWVSVLSSRQPDVVLATRMAVRLAQVCLLVHLWCIKLARVAIHSIRLSTVCCRMPVAAASEGQLLPYATKLNLVHEIEQTRLLS